MRPGSGVSLRNDLFMCFFFHIQKEEKCGMLVFYSSYSMEIRTENKFILKCLFLVERERGKDRESSSISWFTPQMPAMASAGPVHSLEPATSSGSPIWVQEPKGLFPRPLKGS